MPYITLTTQQEELVKKVSDNYATNQLCIDNKDDDKMLEMSEDSIIRFSVANDWNYDNTVKALDKWIAWRVDKKPHKVQQSEVIRELKTQKAYWYGVDKQKHPVCVMKPQYHFASVRDYEECLRFSFFTAEEGVRLAQKPEANPDGKFIIIYDGQYVGLSNLELSLFKEIMDMIQQYPERLLCAYVIKPNWSFSSLLAMVRPFLDPVTASKIVTIRDYNDLFQYVDKEQVQKEFGGSSEYDLNKALAEQGN